MSSEPEMVTCPAAGCDYSGPRNSVAAHYSGTTAKPDHDGGYERCKTRLDSDSSESSTDTETNTDSTVESKPDNSPSQPTEGSDPTHGAPPPQEGSQGTSGDAALEAARDGCPRCNGRMIDTRNKNTLKSEDGRMYDTPDDFYCSECGRGFEWEDQ